VAAAQAAAAAAMLPSQEEQQQTEETEEQRLARQANREMESVLQREKQLLAAQKTDQTLTGALSSLLRSPRSTSPPTGAVSPPRTESPPSEATAAAASAAPNERPAKTIPASLSLESLASTPDAGTAAAAERASPRAGFEGALSSLLISPRVRPSAEQKAKGQTAAVAAAAVAEQRLVEHEAKVEQKSIGQAAAAAAAAVAEQKLVEHEAKVEQKNLGQAAAAAAAALAEEKRAAAEEAEKRAAAEEAEKKAAAEEAEKRKKAAAAALQPEPTITVSISPRTKPSVEPEPHITVSISPRQSGEDGKRERAQRRLQSTRSQTASAGTVSETSTVAAAKPSSVSALDMTQVHSRRRHKKIDIVEGGAATARPKRRVRKTARGTGAKTPGRTTLQITPATARPGPSPRSRKFLERVVSTRNIAPDVERQLDPLRNHKSTTMDMFKHALQEDSMNEARPAAAVAVSKRMMMQRTTSSPHLLNQFEKKDQQVVRRGGFGGTIRRTKNDQAAAAFSQQSLATRHQDLRSLAGTPSIMSGDFWQRPQTARASTRSTGQVGLSAQPLRSTTGSAVRAKSGSSVRRGTVQSGQVSSAARKGAVQASGSLGSSIPTAKKKTRRGTQLAAASSSRTHVRDDSASAAMVATKEAGMSMPTRELTPEEKAQKEADKKRYDRLKAADRQRRHYWLPDIKGSDEILTPQDARDMLSKGYKVTVEMSRRFPRKAPNHDPSYAMEGCTLVPSGSQRMAPPDAIVLKSKDQIVRSSSGVSAGGISDAWILPDDADAGSAAKDKTDKDKANKLGDRKKRASVQLLRKHTSELFQRTNSSELNVPDGSATQRGERRTGTLRGNSTPREAAPSHPLRASQPLAKTAAVTTEEDRRATAPVLRTTAPPTLRQHSPDGHPSASDEGSDSDGEGSAIKTRFSMLFGRKDKKDKKKKSSKKKVKDKDKFR